jgi:TolB-like protein
MFPMNLWAELQRRHVVRVAGLYLVGAWLAVQVAATLLPVFDAPGWVMKVLVGLLLIGAIPTLIFSWVFELTSDGIRRERDLDRSPGGVDHTARKLDIAVIMLLLTVVAVTLFDSRGPAVTRVSDEAAAVASAQSGNGTQAPARDGGGTAAAQSIAVLAFADLSPAKDQEYFADGISEEILNALAKIRGLHVAGRTSAFHYKGRNEDLRSIGRALNVAHVLEGSVRKQGDRVRITAQLIRSDDGFHLWSETFDGDLSDVFMLQERIARAIASELQVVLQGDSRQRLVPVATENPEAYANFLQANAIFNRRERLRFANGIELLDEALRLDPTFARAHARLAAFHVLAPEYIAADVDASIAAAEQHARRAIELLPTLAEPHTVLGYAQSMRSDFVAEREWYERALALEPDDVLSNFWYAIHFVRAGYLQGAAPLMDRVLELEPMLPNGLNWRAWLHEFDGDASGARRLGSRALDLGLQSANLVLAFVEHREGNSSAAIAAMERGIATFAAGVPEETAASVAAGVFGDDPARQRAVAHILALLDSAGDASVSAPLPFWLILLDDPATALHLVTVSQFHSHQWALGLWHPRGLTGRQLPEFADFARKTGLAALWDRHGPPDMCAKLANGDYRCHR